jgi:hypothetical protein
MCRNKEYVL